MILGTEADPFSLFCRYCAYGRKPLKEQTPAEEQTPAA